MDNRRSAPVRSTKSVCVIEVVKAYKTPSDFWQVFVSIPGHSGMFTRTWSTPQGRFSSSQMHDFVQWLQMTAQNAVLASGGVQLELELSQDELDATERPSA